MRLTASGSAATVHEGERVTLTIDIAMKSPRLHVYAPDVEGYVPLDWKMSDSPAIKTFPAKYPPSKDLRLQAIKEKVPVFKGEFRLTRDVVIAAGDKVKPLRDDKGMLTIAGTLRVQTCDDTKCYPARSIPVAWKLRVD